MKIVFSRHVPPSFPPILYAHSATDRSFPARSAASVQTVYRMIGTGDPGGLQMRLRRHLWLLHLYHRLRQRHHRHRSQRHLHQHMPRQDHCLSCQHHYLETCSNCRQILAICRTRRDKTVKVIVAWKCSPCTLPCIYCFERSVSICTTQFKGANHIGWWIASYDRPSALWPMSRRKCMPSQWMRSTAR